jgi:hypothetical protein
MTTFTNNSNLPQSVFNLLAKNRYSGTDVDHDYSATTLLKPPRMVMLERRHADDLEEDVLDRLWSMFGSVAHHLLEEQSPENEMSETRLFAEVGGRKISGQFDGYHPAEERLDDYKVTSVWTIVYDSRSEEWAQQLNILAYLLRTNGYGIKNLRIVVILRNWSKSKSLQGGDYPNAPIKIIDVPLWDHADAAFFILQRVGAMGFNEGLADDDLAPCTPEEMWEKPTVFAVMKDGRKSAVKLFDDYGAAGDFCAASGKGHSVVTRPGKRTRCEEYCAVNKFCNIFKEYSKTIAPEE